MEKSMWIFRHPYMELLFTDMPCSFKYVRMIDATDRISISRSFQNCCSSFGLTMETGDCHQIFLGWLREQRDSFLLIYDNYHNGLLDLDTFMPYGADVGCVPCHVLVTTRLEDY